MKSELVQFSDIAKVLANAGANEDKVQRYEMLWKRAKDTDAPRPCPICFAKEPRGAGEISLFGQQDGSSSAKCACGHLVTDFADPWIEQKKTPD